MDPTLNKLFDGFTIIFAPALVVVILGFLGLGAWMVASLFERIRDGFVMGAQLRTPMVITTTDAVASDVLRMRAADDAERLERLRQARADQRLKKIRRLEDTTPGGTGVGSYLLSEEQKENIRTQVLANLQRKAEGLPEQPYSVDGEIDVTNEYRDLEKRFLIAKNGTDGWTFFHSSLRGRSTERGARDAKFLFIATKSLARRFALHEAHRFIEQIPNRRELCVVDAFDDASPIERFAIERSKVSTSGASNA